MQQSALNDKEPYVGDNCVTETDVVKEPKLFLTSHCIDKVPLLVTVIIMYNNQQYDCLNVWQAEIWPVNSLIHMTQSRTILDMHDQTANNTQRGEIYRLDTETQRLTNKSPGSQQGLDSIEKLVQKQRTYVHIGVQVQ